jgi:hypothetical protein
MRHHKTQLTLEVTAVMTLTFTFNQHLIDDNIMNLSYIRTLGISYVPLSPTILFMPIR